jgi:hypothetical protein
MYASHVAQLAQKLFVSIRPAGGLLAIVVLADGLMWK